MKNIDLEKWLHDHGADHAAEIADELDKFVEAGGCLALDWEHGGYG